MLTETNPGWDHGDTVLARNQSYCSRVTCILPEISVSLSVWTITRHYLSQELSILVFQEATATRYFKLLQYPGWFYCLFFYQIDIFEVKRAFLSFKVTYCCWIDTLYLAIWRGHQPFSLFSLAMSDAGVRHYGSFGGWTAFEAWLFSSKVWAPGIVLGLIQSKCFSKLELWLL